MGYSVLLVLVKDPKSNHPKDIMDDVCDHHLFAVAKGRQVSGPLHKDRDEFKVQLPGEIKEFLGSERRLLYFGISGDELDLVIKARKDKPGGWEVDQRASPRRVNGILPANDEDHAKVVARLEDAVRGIISAVGNGENSTTENEEVVSGGVKEILAALAGVKPVREG